MATNDFIPVAPGPGANVLTQTAYAASSAASTGYQSGVAPSAGVNKSLRQGTTMAAVVAQMIVDVTGQNAVDDGTTATLLTNLKNALLFSAGHGQCRLSVASATSLVLKPYNGQNLIINGIVRQIPAAGVSISNAGLTAATLYYVYASFVSNAVVLELSATGHSAGTNGVETKTGDATRTLVGMIYTDTGAVFADSLGKRYCANWFNRRAVSANGAFGPNSTSSISSVELSTANRLQFVAWSDEMTRAVFGGTALNSVVGPGSAVVIAIDGTGQLGNNFVATSPIAASGVGFTTEFNAPLTEGFHFSTLYGATVTGGTATFNGISSVQVRI